MLSGVLAVSDSSAGERYLLAQQVRILCVSALLRLLCCPVQPVLLTRAQYMASRLNLPQLLLCMISWLHLGVMLSAILVSVDGAQFGVLEEVALTSCGL